MKNLNQTVLGIELGSTRIKAVLIGRDHLPAAAGSFEWENQLVNGVWTYSMEAVREGLQACYRDLKRDVKEKYGVTLTAPGAIGVSGMMHGYLPFDKDGRQLAEFRTWRNTMTGEAAEKLTACFGFNIPQRWSIAHLYQAYLNGEEHVKDIAQLTTLAGYIHYLLTGEKNMGIGEASGMFPIDSSTLDYDEGMLAKFEKLLASGADDAACSAREKETDGRPVKELNSAAGEGFLSASVRGNKVSWHLRDILPKVLPAGSIGGYLTPEGAKFLDPEGDLLPGIPVAPCEGDAGTGMAATNSVRERTGNVSAGTSDFAMIVTDHALKCQSIRKGKETPGELPESVHREIDMVTTPAGAPVAMVHCNNCTSDINAWVGLFGEFAEALGVTADKGKLFTLLFEKALEGDADCGGLLSYNYFSGEGVTGLDEGRPLFLRTPDARFTLANFMRTHLLSALATLKIGMDILTEKEQVQIDKLYGHGGFFKTPGVGQRMLSAAINVPVSCMETAGEGGPYGMALLCAYMLWKEDGETLADYLDNKVFRDAKATVLMADAEEVEGFNRFLEKYKAALPVERTAVEVR